MPLKERGLKKAVRALFLYQKEGRHLKKLKQKSLAALSGGLQKFEDSRNAVKHSDYTDLQTFMHDFLNTPDKKQRQKLAAEFQKRHSELYQFLKENPELVAAETEISRMISAAVSGETQETDSKQLSNLMEMIEESMKHDVQ